jgi:CRP-like cAMP-binding protein
MTYYLVSGEVELRAGGTVVSWLRSDTPEANHPITPGTPRRFSAYAATAVEFLVFDNDLLDVLVTWDQTGVYDVSEITGEVPVDSNDWMAILLQIKAFHRIPASNLQAIFLRLERVNYRAGAVVIKQGEEGDYFYAITAGHCSVAREYSLKPDGIRLAELGPGDSFGDEALISDARRSATVTMLTDGALVRLNKSDFNSLLHEPLLQRVSYAQATERVANAGARWLDVRLPSEFKSWHLAGAINLPLHMLRLNLTQLDASVHHVVVCDTGRRSSAGAFILNGRGYDAAVLQDGLPPAAGVRDQ